MTIANYFFKKKLYVIKNNKLMLEGDSNLSDGLWDISSKKRTSYNHKTATPITTPTISPTSSTPNLPTMLDNAWSNSAAIKKPIHIFLFLFAKNKHIWNWRNTYTLPVSPLSNRLLQTQLRTTISAHGRFNKGAHCQASSHWYSDSSGTHPPIMTWNTKHFPHNRRQTRIW